MSTTDKFCGGCRQTKPLTAFSKHRYMLDGRQLRCKVCSNAYAATWRSRQPKAVDGERVTR